MDNRATSFLPARRVVTGEVFKPEVVERKSFLGITIRVGLVPSIEITCERLDDHDVPGLPTVRIR